METGGWGGELGGEEGWGGGEDKEKGGRRCW